MKKILALMPLLVLGLFMSWMQKNFYGTLIVIPQEGQKLEVLVDGSLHDIQGKTEIRLWAKEHQVTLRSDSYEDKIVPIDLDYHGEFVIDTTLNLAIGLEEAYLDVPYRLKNNYTDRGDYSDNQMELVMKYGSDSTSHSVLGDYFDDAFRALFSPDFSRVIVRKGDLLNETVALYDLDSDSELSVLENVLSFDWSDDSSFAIIASAEDDSILLQKLSRDGSLKTFKKISGLSSVDVSISPNMDRVILTSRGQLPERNLFAVSLSDGTLKQLTTGGYVYGFKWFAGRDMLLIDMAGEGSSLRSLFTKHLSSGELSRLSLDVPIEKVYPYDSTLIYAKSFDPQLVMKSSSLSFGDVLEELEETIEASGESDLVHPEQFFRYDLEKEQEIVLHRNFIESIRADSLVLASSGLGLYVQSKDRLYLLTFEL